MGVNPSGQDDEQMEHFRQNGCEWFIRAIANKLGKIKFDVFDFTAGIIYEDVQWAIEFDALEDRKDFWRNEIKNKVNERQYTYKSGKPWRGGKHRGRITSYGGVLSDVPQHLRRYIEHRGD